MTLSISPLEENTLVIDKCQYDVERYAFMDHEQWALVWPSFVDLDMEGLTRVIPEAKLGPKIMPEDEDCLPIETAWVPLSSPAISIGGPA